VQVWIGLLIAILIMTAAIYLFIRPTNWFRSSDDDRVIYYEGVSPVPLTTGQVFFEMIKVLFSQGELNISARIK
jgi:hypothetical protein